MKFLIIFSFFIVFGLINSERTPVNPFDDADTGSDSGSGSPFDEIATRAPSTIQERQQRIQQKALQELERPQTFPAPRRRVIHRYVDENGYTYTRGGYYRPAIGGALYNIYPILYPKGADYCPQLRGVFRFTCQPSKPLRLDLVEFCKQYAAFCGVINTHRLPGPGLGPPPDPRNIGHVGVSGNFGFSIGVVPGLEVNAGWGVDVGPLPIGDSIGVNVDSGVGILGASPPLKYRRGMDSPRDARGGLVGVSGGVGVDAPGSGPIGVGTGVGVG